ncbi:hypothetical protein ANN_13156 [Periplaneta americana]|uniref:Uncharacterized protein n=1 Tax=Periplaneta americana TaxID=6978 RepID=A0ABQ8TM40_PERAM|nr:hypothetical protein ANN_13156 [Periplaneta americana]
MAGLCEGGNEPADSLKIITAREGPRPTSRLLASRPHAEAEVDDHPIRMEGPVPKVTQAFAHIGLRETPEKPQPGNLPRPGIEPGPPGFAARRADRYSTDLELRNHFAGFQIAPVAALRWQLVTRQRNPLGRGSDRCVGQMEDVTYSPDRLRGECRWVGVGGGMVHGLGSAGTALR